MMALKRGNTVEDGTLAPKGSFSEVLRRELEALHSRIEAEHKRDLEGQPARSTPGVPSDATSGSFSVPVMRLSPPSPRNGELELQDVDDADKEDDDPGKGPVRDPPRLEPAAPKLDPPMVVVQRASLARSATQPVKVGRPGLGSVPLSALVPILPTSALKRGSASAVTPSAGATERKGSLEDEVDDTVSPLTEPQTSQTLTLQPALSRKSSLLDAPSSRMAGRASPRVSVSNEVESAPVHRRSSVLDSRVSSRSNLFDDDVTERTPSRRPVRSMSNVSCCSRSSRRKSSRIISADAVRDAAGEGRLSMLSRASSRRISRCMGSTESLEDSSSEEEDEGNFKPLPTWLKPKATLIHDLELLRQNHARGRSSSRDGSVIKRSSTMSEEAIVDGRGTFLRWMQRNMIQPSSKEHIVWEVLGLMLIVFDLVLVPLDAFGVPDYPALRVVVWCGRIFWSLDILVSFLTADLDAHGTVIRDPRAVARKYVRTWMPFDLGCLMADWGSFLWQLYQIDTGNEDLLKLVRLPKIMRMLKLLRLAKAPNVERFISEHIRSEQVILYAGIIKNMCLMLALSHVIACIWYALGQLSRSGWVYRLRIKDKDLNERYAWALHWSLSQFTGEQIFSAQTIAERYFAVVILILFFLFSCLFVSSITAALTRLELITSSKSSQLASLRRYLLDNEISASLSVRVQRNAQRVINEQERNAPESSVKLLFMIWGPLRSELHFEMYSPILSEHGFFRHYYLLNPQGAREICSSIVVQHVARGDLIFSTLETDTEPRMYFIRNGSMIYTHNKSRTPQKLSKGDFAVEASLWTKWVHRGEMRGAQDTDLLVLFSEKFSNIVAPYPTDHAQWYAQVFVDVLNDSPQEELTDLRMAFQHEGDILKSAFPESLTDDSASGARGAWGAPLLKKAVSTTFNGDQ